jgi:hypothetical protein
MNTSVGVPGAVSTDFKLSFRHERFEDHPDNRPTGGEGWLAPTSLAASDCRQSSWSAGPLLHWVAPQDRAAWLFSSAVCHGRIAKRGSRYLRPNQLQIIVYIYFNLVTICCCVLRATSPWWRKGSATHFYLNGCVGCEFESRSGIHNSFSSG